MIIKAKTEYTKDLTKKYIRFNVVKNTSQIVIYCILELFALGTVGFLIFMALVTNATEDVVFVTVFSIIFPFVVPLMVFFLPTLMINMNKHVFGGANYYEFSDDEVVIESTLPTAAGQIKANYSYFKSIYETKENFYLYISEHQAYILRKEDIIEGSSSDLQNLLRKNIPANKYIVKK